MRKVRKHWFQYVGAIHMHTTDSDGTKPLDEVVQLGRDTGLEFMMFSDHMSLRNKEAGGEGFYGKTLVTIGYEHNDLNDHHHYLLFDSPRVYPKDMTPAQYVAAGATDGAVGIMAHPDEIRTALIEHPAYPWTDWNVAGFTGIELWNQMSEWTEKLTRFNKLVMAFSPRKSMVSPTDRILKKWDDLSRERKVVGIAGADAHAFPIKVGPMTVEIFPYKVHFRTLRCFVILSERMSSDFEKAKTQLYDAIRECRLFFANERWGAAERFEFTARAGDNEVTCGGRLPLTGEVVLQTRLPSRANLRLIHNGEPIVTTQSDSLDFKVESPGIYRVEAHKGKRGWIYSNHIRIGI
ncbi:MAG: histidinol-phosphatase [bacterium]